MTQVFQEIIQLTQFMNMMMEEHFKELKLFSIKEVVVGSLDDPTENEVYAGLPREDLWMSCTTDAHVARQKMLK